MAEWRYRDLRECAERDVRLRQHVYPVSVYKGRTTQAAADEEISKMWQIVDILRRLEREHEELPLGT